MQKNRNLALITLADFIVRTAYQMGKTPLLPIFAANLGATDIFLGLIVSVSTLTGMILKPMIGLLSDCLGRRSWLILGTILFIIIPFTYSFVHSPKQLFAVRIIHGLATAIYGPITLAYVAENFSENCAERIGWFSTARSASYIMGPLLAGWLLLSQEPSTVFTIIGLLSSIALLPILSLPKSSLKGNKSHLHFKNGIQDLLSELTRLRTLWFAGSLEALMYLALYGIKSFLPVYGFSSDLNVAVIGGFFAIQEGTHLVLKPIAGRLGDRFGHRLVIIVGLSLLGHALLFLVIYEHSVLLVASALTLGCSQALIIPSTIKLISDQVRSNKLGMGLGMGLLGMMKNASKILGPILVGIMIHQLDFIKTFTILGCTLQIISFGIVFYTLFSKRDETVSSE